MCYMPLTVLKNVSYVNVVGNLWCVIPFSAGFVKWTCPTLNLGESIITLRDVWLIETVELNRQY